MQTSASAPIIVLGAPRSGTSLIARFLHDCKISMGEDLLESDTGNPAGYFEDINFIDFHRRLLEPTASSAARIFEDSTMRVKPFDFTPSAQDITEAENLICQRNARQPAWGWKDPRTCLFLPFWNNLLPNARYILVYKHPLEISASLLRMGKNWDLALEPEIAVNSWAFYMSEALRFIREMPEDRYLIANTNALLDNPSALIERLLNWSSTEVDAQAFTSNIVPELITKTMISRSIQDTFADYFPGAANIFEDLEKISMQPMSWIPDSDIEAPPLSALQLDSRTALAVMQNEIQSAAAEQNNRSREELSHKTTKTIRYRFAQECLLQNQLETSHAEMDRLTTTVQSLQAKLEECAHSIHQLTQNKEQLEAEHAELLNSSKAQTEQLEQSKVDHALLIDSLKAQKEQSIQQAARISEMNIQQKHAHAVHEITEGSLSVIHCDLFGRVSPNTEPLKTSAFRRGQIKRATTNNWSMICGKIKSKQTWMADIFTFLNLPEKSETHLQNTHWELVAKDISKQGHLGNIRARTCKQIFAAIQSEYAYQHAQAASIPIDAAYQELAARIKMPLLFADNWSRQYTSLLAEQLQPTDGFIDWLNMLKQKGGRWICSGFHGFGTNALINILDSLDLPMNPAEYLCTQGIPQGASPKEHFAHWSNSLQIKSWRKISHLGDSVERDFHWPKQAGIRNCHLIVENKYHATGSPPIAVNQLNDI